MESYLAQGTTTQKGIRKLHVLHLRRERQGQESIKNSFGLILGSHLGRAT